MGRGGGQRIAISLTKVIPPFEQPEPIARTKMGVYIPRRQKYGEIPSGFSPAGELILGKFEERFVAQKQHNRAINHSRQAIRQLAKEELSNIQATYRSLSPIFRLDYLEYIWQELEMEAIEYKQQYALYGKNSIQGRVLQQSIASTIYLINKIENIANHHHDIGI